VTRCAIPGCPGEVGLIYLDHGICDAHWMELNADDAARARLRVVLGLDETASPAMEEREMSENNIAAENAATTEEAMPKTETETKSKATKKARTPKAAKPAMAKKTKVAKATTATAKKAAKPKEDREPVGNRTFAVRITDDELAAIHKASGPRNATRFARAVLAAFAGGDSKAFGRVLEEAAKSRG
jgi:hypothetical protein